MCKTYTGNTVEELTDLSEKDVTGGDIFELSSKRWAEVFKCKCVKELSKESKQLKPIYEGAELHEMSKKDDLL